MHRHILVGSITKMSHLASGRAPLHFLRQTCCVPQASWAPSSAKPAHLILAPHAHQPLCCCWAYLPLRRAPVGQHLAKPVGSRGSTAHSWPHAEAAAGAKACSRTGSARAQLDKHASLCKALRLGSRHGKYRQRASFSGALR